MAARARLVLINSNRFCSVADNVPQRPASARLSEARVVARFGRSAAGGGVARVPPQREGAAAPRTIWRPMSIYEIQATDDRSGVEDAGPAELPYLHGTDHVLVVPDYIDEDGDQADVGSPGSPGTPGTPGMGASPSERIAKFKATREKREQLALGVVLIFLLFVMIGALVACAWLYNHPDQLYTPTGLLVYIHLFNLQFMCIYAFGSIPLDLEALASEFRWKNIADGRLPGLVSIGAWAFFPVSDVFTVIVLRAKYGWQIGRAHV